MDIFLSFSLSLFVEWRGFFFPPLLLLLLAEDQALLRVFISAARGRLFNVVIVEQFIRVCVWLCVCAALTLSPHSFAPALKYL